MTHKDNLNKMILSLPEDATITEKIYTITVSIAQSLASIADHLESQHLPFWKEAFVNDQNAQCYICTNCGHITTYRSQTCPSCNTTMSNPFIS